jgi:hypothetical protein
MAKGKIRSISIDFSAGTTKFNADVEKVTAKIRQFGVQSKSSMDLSAAVMQKFGGHTVSNMQASSAAIRVFEGNIQNNVRAVERFMTSVLPLGPVLQKAFPLIGAAAFGGLITEVGTKVYEFFREMREANEKITASFRTLNASGRQSNDVLALTNTLLENQIAKLEGRRQNTLKESLMEDRVEADKLADSLNRAFTNLNKLLAEHATSRISMVFGVANDRDIDELFGGKSGVGGVGGRTAKILEEGNQGISDVVERYNQRSASDQVKYGSQDKADMELARTKAIAAATRELKAALDEVNKKIRERQDLIAENKGHAIGDVITKPVYLQVPSPVGGAPISTGFPIGMTNRMVADESIGLEKLERGKIELQQAQRSIPLAFQSSDLTSKLKGAEAARASEALERPLDRMIAELTAKVAEARVKLKAAGLDETNKAIAKAEAEAIGAIDRANAALRKQHAALLPDDPNQSGKGREALRLATTEQTLTTEAALRDKVREVTDSTQDQIKTQQMLNAAIGKGWEAQKAVNVEVELMKKFGAGKYETALANPMSDEFAAVSASRPQVAAAVEDAHTTQADERLRKLQNEIAMQNVLTQAQALGAYAVERAALAEQLRQQKASAAGLKASEEQAAWRNFYAERANKLSGEIARIDEEIGATDRLAEAHGQGAEAVRKATLENKYAAMAKAGGPDAAGAVDEERLKDAKERQMQLTGEALKTGMAYKNAVELIDLQLEALDRVQAAQGKSLEIEISRRNLQNERLDQLARESLEMRGLRDGVRAFFLDMQKDAESAAAIVNKALNSSLDQASGNLAKMLTQKAPKGGWGQEWAKSFQNIGGSMVQSSLKSLGQVGLGAIGKKWGKDLSGLGGKPDGTYGNPIWVKQWGAGFSPAGGGRGAAAGPGVLGGNGGLLGTGQIPRGTSSERQQPQGSSVMQRILRSLMGGKTSGSPSDRGPNASDASGALNMGDWDFAAGAGDEAGGVSDAVDSIGSIDWGGFMADGGLVSPTAAYIVGENGPEILTGASGRIASNSEMSRTFGGGGGVTQHIEIDARGADLGAHNRIMRGMEISHRRTVDAAVRAMHERSFRTPKGGR